MTKKRYEKQQGDFEVRILKDGKLVVVAPDEEFLELAELAMGKRRQTSDLEKENSFGENR